MKAALLIAGLVVFLILFTENSDPLKNSKSNKRELKLKLEELEKMRHEGKDKKEQRNKKTKNAKERNSKTRQRKGSTGTKLVKNGYKNEKGKGQNNKNSNAKKNKRKHLEFIKKEIKKLNKNNRKRFKVKLVKKSMKQQNRKGKDKGNYTPKVNKGRGNKKGKHKRCHSAPCEFATMVPLIKRYTKVENKLRQLRRMEARWNRLKDKSDSALTTFDSSYLAIAKATDNGTTCGGAQLKLINETHQLAMTAHDQLFGCSSHGSQTANRLCLTSGITYDKTETNCSSTTACSQDTTCTSKCDPTANYCTNGCSENKCTCNLTQEMINHVTDVCIPQLGNWSRRYRECFNKNTYPKCKTPCQAEVKMFECQKKECEDCPAPDNVDCVYEECLHGDTNKSVLECQCECFKTLDKKYPVDNKTFCKQIEPACGLELDCFGLAEFERLVHKRDVQCIKPTTLGNSGNFGDCRSQGRITHNLCKTTCTGNTSTDVPNTKTTPSNTITMTSNVTSTIPSITTKTSTSNTKTASSSSTATTTLPSATTTAIMATLSTSTTVSATTTSTITSTSTISTPLLSTSLTTTTSSTTTSVTLTSTTTTTSSTTTVFASTTTTSTTSSQAVTSTTTSITTSSSSTSSMSTSSSTTTTTTSTTTS